MTIQLYNEKGRILATDGIMWVDGRLNKTNIWQEVQKRNKRFEKNFPHKLATHWKPFKLRDY